MAAEGCDRWRWRGRLLLETKHRCVLIFPQLISEVQKVLSILFAKSAICYSFLSIDLWLSFFSSLFWMLFVCALGLVCTYLLRLLLLRCVFAIVIRSGVDFCPSCRISVYFLRMSAWFVGFLSGF